MDLYRIISDLVAERERVQRLILSLEEMGAAGAKQAKDSTSARGRRPMSPAARRNASARMKSYWAKRRTRDDHTNAMPAS
jgi:hypothetical protein